jgi:hypothetical protein
MPDGEMYVLPLHSGRNPPAGYKEKAQCLLGFFAVLGLSEKMLAKFSPFRRISPFRGEIRSQQ